MSALLLGVKLCLNPITNNEGHMFTNPCQHRLPFGLLFISHLPHASACLIACTGMIVLTEAESRLESRSPAQINCLFFFLITEYWLFLNCICVCLSRFLSSYHVFHSSLFQEKGYFCITRQDFSHQPWMIFMLYYLIINVNSFLYETQANKNHQGMLHISAS